MNISTPSHSVIAILSVMLTLSASWSNAASIKGSVTLGGKIHAGAIVTAQHHASLIETSVYTNADGDYVIDQLIDGDYTVTAKASGWRSSSTTMSLQQSRPEATNFALVAEPDFVQSLPSAHWLELLPDGDTRREFILNCGSCHEISSTRVLREGKPRTEQHWAEAIALMRSIDAYGLTPPDFDDANYAKWLNKHFTDDAIAQLKPAALASGAALLARITEYPVPVSPSLPHDLVLGPDGRIWITAFYHNVVWSLDPSSGTMQTFNVNEKPEVLGQVRAMNFDANGQLWVLLGGTESLVRLNPADGSIETFAVGMYPHSIEIDSRGKIWFNDYISAAERIGSIDPVDSRLDLFNVPSAELTKEQGLPLLYGLQIDANDVLWGTMLAANKLFSFDTRTHESKLFDMPAPNSGPRRPGLAPDGSLWIPEFNTGIVARFDPVSETFTRHDLGLATLGPYDVAVDPTSGHVWSAASLGSSMIRIKPEDGSRDTYPFPTEPAYPRHIAIAPVSGDVWTTYSSMPDAHPKIVRIEIRDPDRRAMRPSVATKQ